MKKIFLILFITLTFSSTPDKKINTTKFYNINDRIPSNIYINEFTLDKDPVNQINHYYKKQIFNNISVFGRSIKIHYNKNNVPSSMSDNSHNGEFENPIPSIDIA